MLGRNLDVAIRVFGVPRGLLYYLLRSLVRRVPRLRGTCRELTRPRGRSPLTARLATSDWAVIGQVFADEDYAVPRTAHADALRRRYEAILAVGRTPVVVDGGAYVGLSSVWFAECFPRARVFAVEPDPGNLAILARNVAAHPDVEIVAAGLSDRVAALRVENPAAEPWARRCVEAEAGDIPTVTIAMLRERVPDGDLLVVKLDIEGAERHLMRSNTGWVEDTALVVFEDHDWMLPWDGSAHALLAALTREPRAYLRKGENTFSFSHRILAPHRAE